MKLSEMNPFDVVAARDRDVQVIGPVKSNRLGMKGTLLDVQVATSKALVVLHTFPNGKPMDPIRTWFRFTDLQLVHPAITVSL